MASGSSLGRDPCSIPRAPTAPGLSSMWLQPPAPALSIPPDPRSTIAYSSLPLERPLLQGRPDHPDPLPLPSAATQFPYVHGWATASHISGSCYGPFTSRNQYLPTAGPMEHFYSQAQLQPVAHLQLVQMQPPSQGHVLSAPLQDGTGLYLYNYATLAPIPLEERSPVVQGGRTAPVPPASEAEVVLVLKEVEPEGLPTPAPVAGQCPVKPDSREVQAPQGVRNRADVPGELPAQQAIREAQQTSIRLEEDQSQAPVLDGHHPPRHPQPSGKESLLPICKDDFKLPADLISIEYSDIEELIASLEPLIPEGPFPPLDPKEKRQEGTSEAQLSQSCLPMEVEGSERSFPLSSADKEAIVDPYKLDPGAQKLPSPPKKPEATFPNTSKLSEELRTTMLMSPIPVVQGDQKMGQDTSKPLASIPAPRPASILHDIGFPFPPEVSRRKPLKKSLSKSEGLKRKAPGEGNTSGGDDKAYGAMAKRKCCSSPDMASLNEAPQMTAETDPAKQVGMERSQGLQGISSKRPLDGKGKRKATADAAEPLSKIPRVNMSPCRPKKDPGKNERKDKGRINANLAKFKGLKEAKLEGDALSKPVPRSHLALQIMESVQVFYPLGKSSVSSMPPRKLQLFPPPPKTITEKVPVSSIQPKPVPSSHIKPMGSFLPKPSLISTTRPPHTFIPKPPLASIPKVAASLLSKPLPTPLPKAGGSSMSWQLTNFMPKQAPEPNLPGPVPSTAQLSQGSRLGVQASRARKTQALPLRSFTAAQNPWRSSNTLILRRHESCMFQPPSPPYKGDTFIPWRTPPNDLEESSPITEEQRPIREMMKWQAQKEREEAAQWTAAGRVKFFVEREKEMEISISYGYPQR